MMQPFLDGSLSEEEVARAQQHLDTCSWCAKRYRFEEQLRHYVRVAVSEPMSPELKA
jgi:anti-sigma factor RsiW